MKAPVPHACLALAALFVALAASAAASAAPPLVLYDPGSAAPASLSANTVTAPAEPCGLDRPCTDLNTTASASLSHPFLGGIPYGVSGEASAGVSNHGQGGSLGVLAWMKPTEDTTLSIGVSAGISRWNGSRFTVVPVAARP